jgi:hypothetical protein
MNYGRRSDILKHFADDVFHLAPIPVVYHQCKRDDLVVWHADLIQDARAVMREEVLEVPDVRHVHTMGNPPHFTDSTWSEQQIPAVGIWHRVPTNGFLGLDTTAVRMLRQIIEERYLCALATLDQGDEHPAAWISESWIQFYKNGDYKVLHNHERYGPPYPKARWAGAYYIDDGDPDPTMPYSGIFSFRVRTENYFIRPRAGLLLMWPADILHEVHPFYGARERVVVNFNINTM